MGRLSVTVRPANDVSVIRRLSRVVVNGCIDLLLPSADVMAREMDLCRPRLLLADITSCVD